MPKVCVKSLYTENCACSTENHTQFLYQDTEIVNKQSALSNYDDVYRWLQVKKYVFIRF